MSRVLPAVAVALALSSTAIALADEPASSPKRPLPDYDGVPEPGPTAIEVVAWAPRVILFPAWVASEFVIRRPLGWLIVTTERNNWASDIILFFANADVGIVPTFYVDLGFRPFFGFYFFWDHAGHPRHSMRARALGTVDGVALSVADRWQTDEAGSRFQLQAGASLQPDRAFYGIGPRTLDSDLTRYSLVRAGGSVSQDWLVARGVRLAGDLGIRRMTFGEPSCCGESPVASLPMLPPGLGGYTAVTESIEATFDSRAPRPAAQDGVRVRLAAVHGTDLKGGADWLSASITAGGFWDVASMGRILGMTVTAALAEPLSGEVPFPELVSLGGNGLAMPGLRSDRLLGRSALSASVRYEWPIWVVLNGVLQTEVGNVFGPRFEDFDPALLRLSIALGFRTAGAPDHAIQMLVGVGTETFAQGTTLTSARLVLGGTYGF